MTQNEDFSMYEDGGSFGDSAPLKSAAVKASPAPAKPDYTQALIDQILGQGTSSKWTGQGFGSAQANAADMAKILSGIGISDISQFGKITKTIPGYSYETEQGTVDVPEQTVTTYGNKVTGQEVPNTYSERQTGNMWGGTFSGKGNTGYGVQFDAQGNPRFYTQGASSNDLVNLFADDPLLGAIAQVGAAYFGGPAGSAALAAAMGKNPVDIMKSAALSYAGGQAANAVSGLEGITDVLGKTGTDIAANATKQFVGSGGKVDPVEALLSSGLSTGLGNLTSGVNMGDLTPAQRNLLANSAIGLAKGQPLDQVLTNAAVSLAKGASGGDKLTSSFGPGDAKEFSDSLIEGYFQPGGEGYAGQKDGASEEDTSQQDSSEEDTSGEPYSLAGNADEMTVREDPENLDAFLRELSPYQLDEGAGRSVFAKDEDIPEFETVAKRGAGDIDQIEFDPMDLLRDQYDVAGNGEEMTVRENPENLDSFLRELNPYLADEQPGERTIPAERESDIKDDEVTPDTLPFDPNDILPDLTTATPATKATASPTKPAVSPAASPAAKNAATASSTAALMNFLSGNNDVAHIKSYKELFGHDLFEPAQAARPASTEQQQEYDDWARPARYSSSEGPDEEEFFKGGHVDDFSVDALLQILRS